MINISQHTFCPFKSYKTSGGIPVSFWNIWDYDFVGTFHIFPWSGPLNVAQYSTSSALSKSTNSFAFVPNRASDTSDPKVRLLIVY